jgi:hypothetical protein
MMFDEQVDQQFDWKTSQRDVQLLLLLVRKKRVSVRDLIPETPRLHLSLLSLLHSPQLRVEIRSIGSQHRDDSHPDGTISSSKKISFLCSLSSPDIQTRGPVAQSGRFCY